MQTLVKTRLEELMTVKRVLVFADSSPEDELSKKENYDIAIDTVLDVVEIVLQYLRTGGIGKDLLLLLSKTPL